MISILVIHVLESPGLLNSNAIFSPLLAQDAPSLPGTSRVLISLPSLRIRVECLSGRLLGFGLLPNPLPSDPHQTQSDNYLSNCLDIRVLFTIQNHYADMSPVSPDNPGFFQVPRGVFCGVPVVVVGISRVNPL